MKQWTAEQKLDQLYRVMMRCWDAASLPYELKLILVREGYLIRINEDTFLRGDKTPKGYKPERIE